MKIEIGEVWISNGGFALEIVEERGAGWYGYEQLNGICSRYIAAIALQARFTKLECEA